MSRSSQPRTHEQDLVAFLNDNDALCPLCDYNLRNQLSSRCPECGHALELTLRIVDRVHTAWLLALVLSATSIGLTAFLVIRLLSGYEPTSLLELTLAGGLLLLTLTAVALPFLRRRYIRLNDSLQWTIAILIAFAWLLTATCFVLSFF